MSAPAMRVVPITDLQFKDKKVLVRCDFNVPIAEGKIQDPARIDASLDTIRYILEHDGWAVLRSPIGRPKGRSTDATLPALPHQPSTVIPRKAKIRHHTLPD